MSVGLGLMMLGGVLAVSIAVVLCGCLVGWLVSYLLRDGDCD